MLHRDHQDNSLFIGCILNFENELKLNSLCLLSRLNSEIVVLTANDSHKEIASAWVKLFSVKCDCEIKSKKRSGCFQMTCSYQSG